MRRALFLAYHFPPTGGAGAQRPARFARELPGLGYEPLVVTAPGPALGRWTPEDASLLEGLPEGLVVNRMHGPEPATSTGWRHRGERWLGLESPSARWLQDELLARGRELASEADLIYTWMQPYEAAPAAIALAREFGKPLVVDLGDPWALDEMMVYPTGMHRRADLRRMRECLIAADAVVMSTPEAASRVRQTFPELQGTPLVAIPNGFDADDFSGPPPSREDSKFRIVHTGYLHTELGRRQQRGSAARKLLGGEIKGVDILTRSHVYLLQALERVVALEPELGTLVELHLVGATSSHDTAVAEHSALTHFSGFVPHTEALDVMRSADLLFLPMQDLPPGKRATIVPGKTYEYLASGRPILAAVPDGDARDLLAEAGNAHLCRPSDVNAMETAVRFELGRFRDGRPAPRPRPDVVERFDYRRLARQLASVFDEVVGRRR